MKLHLYVVARHGRCGADCPWLWTPPDEEPLAGFYCRLFEHDNGDREDGPRQTTECDGIYPGKNGVTTG